VASESKTGYIYHYSRPRFFAHILTVDIVTGPLTTLNTLSLWEQ
jgi:hypothetical protein